MNSTIKGTSLEITLFYQKKKQIEPDFSAKLITVHTYNEGYLTCSKTVRPRLPAILELIE